MGRYDDIIHLPHPTSLKHPRMSRLDRAAQFSPFRALAGYEDAIHETARLTNRKIELDEHEKAALDERLRLLADAVGEGPEAAITYFLPDKKKSGGEYITAAGRVKKIDANEQVIIMMDKTRIPIDDILDVESEMFKSRNESI